MASGIYKITCTANGKYYYGSAKVIAYRWRRHKNTLRKGLHANSKLQNVWNKYGEQLFTFEVDMECPIDKLRQIEQVYLDIYWGRPDCMNIAKDATAPMCGRKWGHHSEETKKKMRVANKEYHRLHPEVVLCSLETRQKLSKIHRGRKRGPASSEHRRRNSEAQRGKVLTKEHKQKIGLAHIGKKHKPVSDIARQHIIEAAKIRYKIPWKI